MILDQLLFLNLQYKMVVYFWNVLYVCEHFDVLSYFLCSFQLQQKIKELKEELSKEQSEKLAMESRIREEVTTEFMELFSNMEKDYK